MRPRWPELPALERLVRDDPFWRYPSHAGCGAGVAHLREWVTAGGGRLFMVTELGMGASITNSIEDIHQELTRGLLVPVMMLEHWPAEQSPDGGEHLDLVMLDDQGPPQWRRVWPTPPRHPQHLEFEAWMCRYGYAALAASHPE